MERYYVYVLFTFKPQIKVRDSNSFWGRSIEDNRRYFCGRPFIYEQRKGRSNYNDHENGLSPSVSLIQEGEEEAATEFRELATSLLSFNDYLDCKFVFLRESLTGKVILNEDSWEDFMEHVKKTAPRLIRFLTKE